MNKNIRLCPLFCKKKTTNEWTGDILSHNQIMCIKTAYPQILNSPWICSFVLKILENLKKWLALRKNLWNQDFWEMTHNFDLGDTPLHPRWKHPWIQQTLTKKFTECSFGDQRRSKNRSAALENYWDNLFFDLAISLWWKIGWSAS